VSKRPDGRSEAGVIPNGFALTFNGRDATDTRSNWGFAMTNEALSFLQRASAAQGPSIDRSQSQLRPVQTLARMRAMPHICLIRDR
jgi:hypothetical protein